MSKNQRSRKEVQTKSLQHPNATRTGPARGSGSRELRIASVEYTNSDPDELAVRLKRAFDLLGLEQEILLPLAESQPKSKMKEQRGGHSEC
jgi:hypothetical protein